MFVGRRTVLTVLIAGVVPAFVATNFLVTGARARRQRLATDWADRAARDLAANRPATAADDLRTAMQYAREPDEYRRMLADALLAANRPDEARSQLLTLWAESPGNGPINLDLGRVAAHRGDLTEAVRYYHGAIDGAWDRGAADARRTARAELARFLIARGERAPAQAELIALTADLPADAGAIAEAGTMLLEAGATSQALSVLEHALELDPANARALRQAGEAAFDLGDYRVAARHLRALAALETLDVDAARQLDLAARVLALDPFARASGARERLRRTVRAFEIAADAAGACNAPALEPLRPALAERAPKVTERKLAADPDAVDDTMALVTRVEDAVSAACAPVDANEAALRLVLRRRSTT